LAGMRLTMIPTPMPDADADIAGTGARVI
jgi:hypothetical protein